MKIETQYTLSAQYNPEHIILLHLITQLYILLERKFYSKEHIISNIMNRIICSVDCNMPQKVSLELF